MCSLGGKLVKPEIPVMHTVFETKNKRTLEITLVGFLITGPKRVSILLGSHLLVFGLFRNASLLVCLEGVNS